MGQLCAYAGAEKDLFKSTLYLEILADTYPDFKASYIASRKPNQLQTSFMPGMGQPHAYAGAEKGLSNCTLLLEILADTYPDFKAVTNFLCIQKYPLF